MLRTLRTLAAAAAVGLGGSARAAPPAVTSDVALARSALAAVDADPLLGPGVIVSVKDRVAVVGGPVRSAEAVGRAEAVVRTVPGIAEVRNACYVQPAGDPLIRPVRDWPSLMTPRRLMADLPVFLRHPRPEAATDPDPTGAAPAERTMVALRPAAPAVNVLLPPVPAAGSVPPPAPPPPGVLTGRPGGVLDAAEAARRADPRFAGLTVVMESGTLVVGGTAARVADAWDLAQNLRSLPGVARVAVGPVGVR